MLTLLIAISLCVQSPVNYDAGLASDERPHLLLAYVQHTYLKGWPACTTLKQGMLRRLWLM